MPFTEESLAERGATLKPLEVRPEAWICFRYAARVLNHDSRHFQADQSQAHRHAVVFVGFDLGAMQRARRNSQTVGELLHFRAELAKFSGKSVNTVGLFMADMRDVANPRWPVGEASDYAERHDRVADGVH